DIKDLSPDAINDLLKYDWPGNVRELENVIERAVILSEEGSLNTKDLLLEENGALVGEKSLTSITELEKKHIVNVLEECGGNCTKSARILGISRMTLYNKIRSYGIQVKK
ncbi:MAG: hypothetical protein GXX97_01010, partial [Dehalococcoidales bacterium]|nr:hypothetical protein [Dehalococcoidales bacterium]